jgi:hypothetical protein
LPWPYGPQDKRQLPISASESDISVTPNVKQMEHMDHVHITDQYNIDKLKTRFRRAHRLTTSFGIINNCDALPHRIHTLSLTNDKGKYLNQGKKTFISKKKGYTCSGMSLSIKFSLACENLVL